jgi:hypothetical protein
MVNPPTQEPSSIIAGDTLVWQKTLPNYPASSGWTLNYRLINAAGHLDIIAGASGSDHLINVLASVSANYVAGNYAWQSFVTNVGGERYTIETGSIEVKANWATQAGGLDTRSNASKILEALEAAWVTASATRAFVFEYKIADRQMRFSTRAEWIAEIDYWRREVAREQRAERIKAGLPSGRTVYLRF